MSATLLVKELKEKSQDFDYYPTTPEILDCVKNHMTKILKGEFDKNFTPTVLDVGAGAGDALMFLTDGIRKAIEKSLILSERMDVSIFPAGTDFLQSNIMPIKTDVVFCNPPYHASGGFAFWAEKIIKEANSYLVYLVLPERWKKNEAIQIAIKDRKASVEILGEFSFLEGDRAARGNVNVVCVDMSRLPKGIQEKIHYRYYRHTNQNINPFELWLSNTFKFDAREKEYKGREINKPGSILKKLGESGELVSGKNYVEMLVQLYNKELLSLQNTYKAISELPYDVLNTLGASVEKLGNTLKENLANIKSKYWHELFEKYDVITSKLCKRSRESLFELLGAQECIDFTESNIYAVTIWVCKHSNEYFDKQLIETYEKLLNQASVQMYKSNKKTFEDEDWRWNRGRDKIEKYCLKLDYRIIISGYGRLSSGYYAVNGLDKTGHELLNDIGTIAQNLGFPKTQKSESFDWTNGQVNFTWPDGTIFIQAKGHSNGNLHLKINIEALKAISIKFGQLKKWIKSASHAAEEMSIPVKEAEKYFDVSHSILPGDSILKICG